MITFRNIDTNERRDIYNVRLVDGRVFYTAKGKGCGKKFFNRHGDIFSWDSEGVVGGQLGTFLRVRDGWEMTETEATPTPRPQASAQPQTDTPTAQVQTAAAIPQADAVTAALLPLFSGVSAQVAAQVESNIMARVQPLLDRVPQEVRHIIQRPDGSEWEAAGEVLHPNFDAVAQRIAAGAWVYLYGPTGSGKNVMAEQIARALGLAFHYQAHTLDRFELTGFIDANGHYQPTEFYKAYTEGGLFMLDELDASDENALITLNSAANGYFAFPCGTKKAHPDFRCIAAGNTCGRGATDEYTGRRVMDASSLGRFIPRYHGYTRVVDMAAAAGDEELVTFAEVMREVKRETGAQILCSPRQIKAIREFCGVEDLTQLLGDTLATYLTEDELNIVQSRLAESEKARGNKYAHAFAKVRQEC